MKKSLQSRDPSRLMTGDIRWGCAVTELAQGLNIVLSAFFHAMYSPGNYNTHAGQSADQSEFAND